MSVVGMSREVSASTGVPPIGDQVTIKLAGEDGKRQQSIFAGRKRTTAIHIVAGTTDVNKTMDHLTGMVDLHRGQPGESDEVRKSKA
ncbi:uncharacterized protein Z520_08901 [Fonsecaea multimorphosa CBS 102226]|uniref:Uncharacterized protein n=1 Tax=Fonsecaea multimorphosa CBS 102226 TaxID=1442371 RepID=A0A0D2JY04_9EURO|nr:uncharacterized protein Z520_08901 [Fonsecaea multimorphosa CBS 102226]KIX95384.1 hypothetical protein Z520_08901 [Fonsecaea multimorphosa CBS 102226]